MVSSLSESWAVFSGQVLSRIAPVRTFWPILRLRRNTVLLLMHIFIFRVRVLDFDVGIFSQVCLVISIPFFAVVFLFLVRVVIRTSGVGELV